MIGADLKSAYTGTIDSQVPDRAFLSFEKNDLDSSNLQEEDGQINAGSIKRSNKRR